MSLLLNTLLNLMPDFSKDFNWDTAIFVGAVVLVGCLVVVFAALATPFVAVQKGKTIKGTMVTVAGISMAVGIVGALAAGFPRGTGPGGDGSGSGNASEGTGGDGGENADRTGSGDTNDSSDNDSSAQGKVSIADVGHFFDLHFVVNERIRGGTVAVANEGTITTYSQRNGRVRSKGNELKETSLDTFLDVIEQEFVRWTRSRQNKGEQAMMRIFGLPSIGEKVEERMIEIAEKHGGKATVINERWSDPTK